MAQVERLAGAVIVVEVAVVTVYREVINQRRELGPAAANGRELIEQRQVVQPVRVEVEEDRLGMPRRRISPQLLKDRGRLAQELVDAGQLREVALRVAVVSRVHLDRGYRGICEGAQMARRHRPVRARLDDRAKGFQHRRRAAAGGTPALAVERPGDAEREPRGQPLEMAAERSRDVLEDAAHEVGDARAHTTRGGVVGRSGQGAGYYRLWRRRG